MDISQALRVLGLPQGSTAVEVKRQYRRLAKTLHPDVAGVTSNGLFLELNKAYEVLLEQGTLGGYKLTHQTIIKIRKV